MSKKSPPQTPETDCFRAWVASALVALEQPPARVSRAIGMSVNALGAFLREPERDITLSRAAAVERHLRRIAKEQGKALPLIAGGAHG